MKRATTNIQVSSLVQQLEGLLGVISVLTGWLTVGQTLGRGVTSPVTLSPPPAMSEAARNLSVQDLFRLLDEKLATECTRLRATSLPPAVSTASLESDVSEHHLGRRCNVV